MRIDLIRHGETAYTAQGRYQGASDLPLSPEGRAALGPAGFCPPVVYASPMARAVETARLLFPAARVVAVPGLEELSFGRFEGRTFRELAEDRDYRAWVEGGCRGRCPGGTEDRETFVRRTCGAFLPLVEGALRRGEERLVVVAHGGTQMAVLSRLALPRRDYYHWHAAPGVGFRLRTDPRRGLPGLRVLGRIDYTKES